ncbi:TPA: conjugative relaxase [Enterobacter hormaechei]|nr:conjugative relaxase [Enterobacter hormaechei]
MMSVAPVASAGEAAGYYSNSDNYYFLGSLQSLWMGEGAKELGLEGNVRGDDLTAVLEGRLPDGSRLGKEVNGQHVHRPGHDLTFSAPKSVSILALIGNDKEMLEAHYHAVRVAAGYVEKLISARNTKDGVTSIVHTGKMVAAAYTHDTSRNLDPLIHTHLLVANMTEYEGKWKALATDYIHNAGFIETVMKHQVTLGKIYRGALRERVESLGHEVKEVGKHGMWEIKAIPDEVVDEYSSRGREIRGAVGAEATLRSRDVAAKDTRRAKVDPSRMRLMERWLGQMKEKGFDLKAYQESVVPRDAGLRETAPQPERDHQVKPVPAGPEQASLQTSSTAEKSVDTPAQPAERESLSRQPVSQQTDTLSQPAQTGPEKTPAARSFPAAQLDTEIPRPELTEAVRLAISQLSDSKTRFTFGELMMTTAELSEQLSVAGDREHSLKAKDRLEVTGISEKGIEVKRGEDTLTLPKDQPLYLSHAYVTAPGGRDNDTGVVLAALNSRDISTQTMNSLAQSGHRAEVFTAEVQDRAEARLQRMKTNASPVQLVRNLSGHDDVSQAVGSLHDRVRTDAGLAVWRAINDQRTVVISELKLATEAQKYHPDLEAIGNEIGAMIKNGELLSVSAGGEPVLVSRATWEMEKAILRVVEEGKGTQQPLLEQVPEAVLNGLTDGQKKSTTLVLGTKDQFIGIQGYAGVGKTTQLKAVISALETLPADVRPVMTGLAPTHQAVKEMSDVGVRAQTIKSFIVEHDQATAAGGKPDYKGQVFLIDESSMAGNQDTAALFQAIASGGGRAVSMGDIDQFESVDVGAPFKLMQERSPMDVAIMKQIVRQKDLQLRGAVHDIIDNRIDAALQRIETQPADRVARSASAALPESAIQETETPVIDIVADWTDRTPEARSRTLIIAQLNADRKAINAGIHAALAARGELGEKGITVPVLDKITHTRHEFNKTEAWQPGMVVKRGDRYQDVLAVDRNGSTVTVRDEEGKIGLYSPKQLITGDVQLFRRSEMEVRTGDLLKFTATDREQGQMANQRYTVESISEAGNIRLKGENGRITINPEKVRAQQHLDYGWAVTGYGAQGASSDYVIALEGTDGGRKALASRRAFYISTSRVKEHVQIYTDGKADWVKAIKMPERDIKTAHDALAPETQRKQAKAIWAMGQSVNKTAIGRAWVRHQGMQEASLTAKIIPATRRFPEPALALPVYDNNGRSAGLALVSLVASPEGRMTQGETRMVMTERARGAVLQRSQSGNTIVASDLTGALDAVRNHPKDGVVWQTGDEPPSAWLLKVSGGTKQDVSPGIVSTLTDEQNVQQQRELMLADLVRYEESGRSRQPEPLLAEVPQEEVIRLKPEDINPRKPEPLNPDADVIARVRGEENTDGQEIKAAAGVRSELEGADKTSGELSRASRVIADLANAERDMVRAAENTERGRTPEREEQTLTRTIQKER